MSLHIVKTLNLLLAHLGVVNLEDVDGILVVKTILVDTDDSLTTGVDACLSACGSFLDTELGQTGFDSLGHAAERFNLLYMLPCAVSDLVGERLHIVATSPWVNLLGDHSLLLDIDLSVAGNTCGEVGRQCDSLVESVGVERLSMTQSGTHGLDTCAAYIVERILLGERPSGCLRVGAESERFGVLGVELLHNLCPKHTCCTHLGNLHEEVHTDGPEERQTRSKSIDIHTCIHTGAEILQTVGESVGKLDVAGGAGLLHVVAGDGDRVELRHILRSVLKYVGDNAHREFGRIYIGVAHHELLENVVLDGTGHLFKLGTLLQTGVDVERKHWKHSTVHGHRHRHFVQRNTVKQHFHILERAD